jgi:hypothetical protein
MVWLSLYVSFLFYSSNEIPLTELKKKEDKHAERDKGGFSLSKLQPPLHFIRLKEEKAGVTCNIVSIRDNYPYWPQFRVTAKHSGIEP